MPNDPFADAMNTSGYAGLIGPNPYLEYTGKVPMAGFYGAPTDAMGNPIASFTQAQQAHDAWSAANPAPAAPAQGTTLNSTPQHGVGALQPGQWDGPDGLPMGTPSNYRLATNANGMPQQQQAPVSQAPQQGAGTATAPQNPIDMRQAGISTRSPTRAR